MSANVQAARGEAAAPAEPTRDLRVLFLGVAAFAGGIALQWASVHWAASLAGVLAIVLGFVMAYSQALPVAFTITKREFASYFNSPIAYIVIVLFLALVGGLFFFMRLFLYNEASLRGLFEMTPWAFLFFAPAIAMRLVAEEKKTGTIELLVTMPVSEWEIVLGKFFGALGLLMVGVALTGAYGVTIAIFGEVDPGPITGGYTGLLLLGAAFTAIGLLASSWTSDQVVAFLVAALLCTFLWMLDFLRFVMPVKVASFFEYLGAASHHRNLERGVVDLRDILYFLSVIGLCLYLSKEALASRKWR